jgi:hypothetical protein
MIGGLLKSASPLALAAAVSLFAGGVALTPAYAADLGGDCCADLEERVAELEATTARKGNRKVSLTISGHVNKGVLYWNAPTELNNPTRPTSGTYLGIDNNQSSTRFGFAGSAKISPTWSAGFSLLIDLANGARTNNISRVDEDGGANDNALRLRDANWWIESSQIGRLTVGRLTGSGPVGTIDLGGVGVVAADGNVASLITFSNSAFALRDVYSRDGEYNIRGDGLKYTSPSIAGFVLSASITETGRRNTDGFTAGDNSTVDGQIWGVDLRYAGEFSGFRLAAGIGYESAGDENLTPANVKQRQVGGSVALMHIATGLFAQGSIIRYTRGNTVNGVTPAIADDSGTVWNVQAGISQNYFGIGKTNLYGEYGKATDMLSVFSTAFNGVDSDMRYYGLGVVQNIDAAAMELYLGWRNYQLDAIGLDRGEINTVLGGARIKF